MPWANVGPAASSRASACAASCSDCGVAQPVEPSPTLALVAAQHPAGVQQLARTAVADDARQQRARAHVAPGETHALEQERRLAARRAEAQVGRHGNDRAGARAYAVDRGDDRLRAGAHRLHEIAGHAREHEELRCRELDVSGPMISCTSPPEQKFSPAPVTTTTLTSSASLRRPKRSRSSAYASNVSGFFRSGRSRVTVPMPSATSHRTCFAENPAAGRRLPATRSGSMRRRLSCYVLARIPCCARAAPAARPDACTAAAAPPARARRRAPGSTPRAAWPSPRSVRRPCGVRCTIQARRSVSLRLALDEAVALELVGETGDVAAGHHEVARQVAHLETARGDRAAPGNRSGRATRRSARAAGAGPRPRSASCTRAGAARA